MYNIKILNGKQKIHLHWCRQSLHRTVPPQTSRPLQRQNWLASTINPSPHNSTEYFGSQSLSTVVVNWWKEGAGEGTESKGVMGGAVGGKQIVILSKGGRWEGSGDNKPFKVNRYILINKNRGENWEFVVHFLQQGQTLYQRLQKWKRKGPDRHSQKASRQIENLHYLWSDGYLILFSPLPPISIHKLFLYVYIE